MNDNHPAAEHEPPLACNQCGSLFCDHEPEPPAPSVELSIAADKMDTVRDFVALMLEDLEEGRLDPEEALELQDRMKRSVAETRAMLDVIYFEAGRQKTLRRHLKPMVVFVSFLFFFEMHLTILLQL